MCKTPGEYLKEMENNMVKEPLCWSGFNKEYDVQCSGVKSIASSALQMENFIQHYLAVGLYPIPVEQI